MTSLRCVCPVSDECFPAGGAGPPPLRGGVGVVKPGKHTGAGRAASVFPGLQFDLQHRFEMGERTVRPGAPAAGSWEPAGPRSPGSKKGRTVYPDTFYQTKYNKFIYYKVFII